MLGSEIVAHMQRMEKILFTVEMLLRPGTALNLLMIDNVLIRCVKNVENAGL